MKATGTAALLLAAASSLASACQDIAPPEFTRQEQPTPTCESDADCGNALCDVEIQRCVAKRRDFPGLLLEVVPEVTDSGFGGFHILRTLSRLAPSQSLRRELELEQPRYVRGEVRPAAEADGMCQIPATVRITLTPQDSYLGLDLPRYSTISDRDIAGAGIAHTYRFEGVPRGKYDLYWEDSGQVPVTDPRCEIVPQVFRGVAVTQPLDLPLVQPAFRPLRVVVPWNDDNLLHGWSVDVVHAATAERLSTVRTLLAESATTTAAGAREVVAELKLSAVVGDDYSAPSERELLRLTPPAGSPYPTLFFSLWILEAFMTGQAALPALRPFNPLVEFQAWVWAEGEAHTPVPGRVEFVATELLDAQGAGFYAFELTRSTEVDAQGQVKLTLPPGVYRARVMPQSAQIPVYETRVRVWANEADAPPQEGRVLEVPEGAVVTGRIRLPSPLLAEGGTVRVTGLVDGSGPGLFRPRSTSTLVAQDGQFRLTGVDCRACAPEAPALYTLVAVPPPGLGLPWSVRSPLSVAQEVELGDLDIEYPQIHFGQLLFKKTGGSTGPFPGALIRAYVLQSDTGQVLSPSAPLCLARPVDPAGLCARRALQVAGVRSAADGSFQLELPAVLSSFGAGL